MYDIALGISRRCKEKNRPRPIDSISTTFKDAKLTVTSKIPTSLELTEGTKTSKRSLASKRYLDLHPTVLEILDTSFYDIRLLDAELPKDFRRHHLYAVGLLCTKVELNSTHKTKDSRSKSIELMFDGKFSGMSTWLKKTSNKKSGALVWHRLYREWYRVINHLVHGFTTEDGAQLPPITKVTGGGSVQDAISKHL